MFTLRRNQRSFYYANPVSKADVISSKTGLPNGEQTRTFSSPVLAYGNVSEPSGRVYADPYGWNIDYDITIVPSSSASAAIKEGARLWVGITPGTAQNPVTHNYTVIRVSTSLNETVVAAKRVNVSA